MRARSPPPPRRRPGQTASRRPPRRTKTLSSAARSPTASAPVSTAASPRLEISTRGGYGIQPVEQAPHRVEQQVAVRAEPAAEDDERHVGHRGDRDEVQRDAARGLVDDRAPRAGRCARAAEKIARASNGGRARCRGSARSAEPRRERGDRARARVDVLPEPEEREVDLARGPVMAAVELAARARARRPCPVPTERNAKSSTPRATPRHCSPTAARLTSFSRLTGAEAPTQLRAEGVALETRHAGRQADARRSRVDDARDADDSAVDPRRVEPGRLDERVAQRTIASSAPPASAPTISTSCRARISPRRSQIAPRRKRAPTSSPSTSAASGTGSKKTAP